MIKLILNAYIESSVYMANVIVEWARHRPLPELILGWWERRKRGILPDDPSEEDAKAALEWVKVGRHLYGVESMIMMNDILCLLSDREPHDDLAPWANCQNALPTAPTQSLLAQCRAAGLPHNQAQPRRAWPRPGASGA